MNIYFDRYAYPSKLFYLPTSENTKIAIVIPCFNEPDILSTLQSLNNCLKVNGVEVIVIINEAEGCAAEISEQNKLTQEQIADWRSGQPLNFDLLVHHLNAPAKHAGVGFARKVGMDEAARRFELANNPQGIICCFDADSTCEPNYLQTIEKWCVHAEPVPHGAAIYFEHPIKHWDSDQAIIEYELHLRYYVQALRRIEFPYAHHTVGSSMAVRSDIYQKVGGMNKRKAGEDFYFLHRVMPTGNFINITDTTIYPSSRASNRVPFGTGRAMLNWQRDELTHYSTYALKSFVELGEFFNQIEAFFTMPFKEFEKLRHNLPPVIKAFLTSISFGEQLPRIQSQSSTLKTFRHNFFDYFNGFMVLKYLHFARDNFNANRSVTGEAIKLLKRIRPKVLSHEAGAAELLTIYRKLDLAC